ncbi:hypothetical protein [uncultured Muribaculum sp.]|jgi:Phage-related minor tail protein|uniref:hypothetical protein n=1 Tax=uncultured Muribaculum sp. TaxID=1918613 RepID=UPI0025B24B5D|nr:hypothetical protein [uncultured Muribaculum sp.]
MNLKNFIPAVLAILGIQDFHKEEGRKVLTAQEKQKLASAGFPAKFADDFEAALNEPETSASNDEADRRVAALTAVLGQTTAQLTTANQELAALKAKSNTDAEQLAAKEATIKELNAKVVTLSELAEPDNTANASTGAASGQTFDIANEQQLGGMPGVMFALDRPYNQRARAAIAATRGMSVMVAAASSVDYSTLQDDLGAFYRTPWRERIQSFLVKLPTIETIFPLESGYQDLATLVNIWLGEFSQADNTIGSNFDNVTKGNYDFGTETLRMFSVMFAHKFQNLAQLEKTWIGSLNREGSDPLKWSFIEYLLAETAKKLHNEREMRRVNGVRKNPNPNQPGRAMEAADGFYEFIRKKVDGHIDNTPDGGTTGKVVYQIKPFALPRITPANIGEVLYLGTSMIPDHIRSTGNVVCYIPAPLVPWYHKYNEAKYGLNQDYKANIMHVKEYPNVRLVPVPNADNHHRIVWTLDGNIKCYEQKAGEMLDFRIEQQDWSLKVWANWKESIWAESVGYKYTNPAEMDGSRQLIWCNDYDRPDDFFVEGQPDANPSAVLHNSIVTGYNKQVKEIDDIEGAKVGEVVNIKCGPDGDNGVTIKKAGKFDLISEEWTPKTGDVISLMKRADGKFIEIGRRTAAASAYMFPNDATAPSVADATVFVTGENTKATAITDLADAVTGTVYTIHGNGSDNASTIANGGNFSLTKAMTLKTGAIIQLVKVDDGKFYEVSRAEAPND